MASLDQLLVLQEHDTTAEQLRHRRLTLPQRDQLVAHEQELAAVREQTASVQGQRDDVARTQKRLEDEVASVEAKVADVHGKLYGGSITSPRELQALQDDEGSLKRHQTNVEDKVIEQMELAVPLDDELERLRARAAELEAAITDAAAGLTVAEAEIDVELDAVLAERAALGGGARPGADRDLRAVASRPRRHRRGPPGGHELRGVPPHAVGGRDRSHPPRPARRARVLR